MVLLRSAALLLIGLWLETQFFGSILQYYAIYFVIGLLAVGLSRRALLGLAAACLVVGPLVITFLLHRGVITLLPGTDRGFEALEDPVALVRALTIDGTYPAIVWSGFFFLGMAIAHLDLRDPKLASRLAAGGAAVGALGSFVGWIGARTFGSDPFGWTHHWTGAAHSESLTWALTSAGIAVGFLGASLWVATRVSSRNPVLAPVLALGQVALSFYLLHLWYSDTWWHSLLPHITTTAAFLGATVVFYAVFAAGAWLWLRVFRRGPVEGVIDFVARVIVRPKPRDAEPRRSVPA
jgi:uncharacterized membrane protein YeiB